MRIPGTSIRLTPGRSWVPWLLIFLFGGIYLAIVISNHYHFRTFWADYGIYNNAFWDFAHFRVNANPLMEPPLGRFCQVHMAFTLNILAPVVYWTLGLITGTYTLLVMQVLIILAGGYFVYLLIREKTGNFVLACLALFHYLVLWGHFSALAADYIDTTVGASMVPIFLYYHERKKFAVASLLYLFILLTKENFPIWLIFISLTLILLHPKDRLVRRINAGYIAVSVFYFVLVFKVLIPAFEDPSRPYWGFAYTALGKTPSEALVFMVTHPLETLKLLFVNHSGNPAYDGVKTEFYVVFLVSGGLVLFANPRYLILFIPLIAQKMFNDHYLRWGINSFYSIEVVSVLSIAVFLTIARLRNRRVLLVAAWVIAFSAFAITMAKLDRRRSLYYMPLKERFYDPRMYRSDFDAGKVHRKLKEIPRDAKVAASENLVPHLAYRSHIHCFPYVREAEFIILLLGKSTYPLTPEQFETEKEKYLGDVSWQVVYNDHPLLILRKKP